MADDHPAQAAAAVACGRDGRGGDSGGRGRGEHAARGGRRGGGRIARGRGKGRGGGEAWRGTNGATDEESVAAWACARLGEPKRALMRRAVHAVGGDAVAQMLVEVDAVQRCGGQLTADGKRRRTPGGVFWNVLRARVSADVYIEIMAQERDVQKRRDRGQARKKRRKQQQQQGKGVSGSGCLASCSAASANKEGSALDEPWCDASHGSDGSDGMSLSVDGLSDADHDALDDAHAATDAADVAQDAWTGRHARNGMSAHVDGRLQVGHGVRVRGGDMVDGMAAVRSGQGVGRETGRGVGRGSRRGGGDGRGGGEAGGGGDAEESGEEGEMDGGQCGRGEAGVGGVGEGASGSGGRRGEGKGTGGHVDVEERVRLDVAVASGAVKQVHHAWRCAVMAGGGAGGEDGWGEGEQGEEGEWRAGDAAVGLGAPAGAAALAVGGEGEGVRGGEERKGGDGMEVDGECEEQQQGGGGEVLAVERHGTHAAASSIAGEGAAVSTPLPCDASESTADRHGSAGGEFEAAAAVEAVHRAGEGGQRVPVKQRLRMPVTYDDVPLVAEGAVEAATV
ncbi:hypothetical protein CLOP_g5915 [Closterium sp. NIES-67]|nr:hypothetical protein CLOP_g5915 [Closterium sp. NIES-67]